MLAPSNTCCLSWAPEQDIKSTLSVVAWWQDTKKRDARNLQINFACFAALHCYEHFTSTCEVTYMPEKETNWDI